MLVMKQFVISLKTVPDIIAICIVLHNLCIINNTMIRDEWIVEVENKLAIRFFKGEIWEDIKLHGGRARLVEMKKEWFKAREDATIVDEGDDINCIHFLERHWEGK